MKRQRTIRPWPAVCPPSRNVTHFPVDAVALGGGARASGRAAGKGGWRRPGGWIVMALLMVMRMPAAAQIAPQIPGTVVAWGGNYYGQCTVPEGLHGVVAIAAGARHNLALKNGFSDVFGG